LSITYTLTDSDGGNFAISGSNLNTAATGLSVGTHSVTVRATDDNGWIKDHTFSITVSHAATGGAGSPMGLLLLLTKAS
jgi:hypothetical protein